MSRNFKCFPWATFAQTPAGDLPDITTTTKNENVAALQKRRR
jgi:hypothetical protein